MEFNTPLYSLAAIFAGILWAIKYWHFFKRPHIILPDKYIVKTQMILRSLVFLIGIVGWGFLAYSLMQPRMPKGNIKNSIEVNDIFFVVDTSGSMKADDFRPNRMEVAKKKILEFVDLKPTDRLGIVIFGTKAFTMMPLTTDHKLVKEMVSQIQPDIRGVGPGTNIGDALALAAGRAASSLAKNKVIILLTDGAANVGTLSPLEAAEQVRDQNIRIYTIGIGTKGDAFMPTQGPFGQTYRQRIPGGGFDMDILQKIAQTTGGKSFTASSEQGLQKVLSEINKLEKSKIDSFGRIIYDELYHFYLVVGILLLIVAEFARRFVIREGV